ncbi:chromosome partitioning protein ParB, partial [Candidatus Nomurabacteria bacterium]|nr:chromosome partitioning protein ParB [Candidatus Nomurabacteria bacterium]
MSDIIIGEKRREVKSDYVQKLADSIKQVGLINPITIAPDNRLIAGYHRLQAFIQLGETRIPAVILNLS